MTAPATSRGGFTLIELLVVIAIIGVLASVVMVSLNGARERSRDAVRQGELRQLQTAFNSYFLQNGRYPPNLLSGQDIRSDSAQWTATIQLLVDAGFINGIPRGPNGNDYRYYDYGRGSVPGAMIVTVLESGEATTEAASGTCRPFTNNWCSSTQASRYWCLCNPY